MLRGIDPLIGPDLLYTLASMGHADQLVVVDRNFPAMSRNSRVHRLDGIDAVRAIRAVLSLMPLDDFVEHPLRCMEIPERPGEINQVQHEVLEEARRATGRSLELTAIERTEFYEITQAAYAVVATGEDRSFGCFILSKGVLPEIGPYRTTVSPGD